MATEMQNLQKEVHENAVNNGWYENERKIPEILCLIHSEVSAALEAYLDNNQDLFPEKIADTVIRIMDMCEYKGIDLEAEILRKL